jgi:hypothetical protein
MPTFIRARLPASREQQSHDRAGEQKLRLGRDAAAVSSADAVEERFAAHPEPGREVLQIGHRRRRSAEHGGVERAPPGGEQAESDEAAGDLEVLVVDVLVRHLVACDVQRGAEEQGQRSRADESAERTTSGDVQRDDHRSDDGVCSAAVSLGDWFRRLFSSPSEPDAPISGEEELVREMGSGAVPGPGLSGPESAEEARAEEEELEPPPDRSVI